MPDNNVKKTEDLVADAAALEKALQARFNAARDDKKANTAFLGNALRAATSIRRLMEAQADHEKAVP